jgi:small GTP-binding protein
MKNIALKIMMLGEIGVGKTSIVRRLVFDSFDSSYKATIGVDIYTYVLSREATALDFEISLVIWDVDGDYDQSIFNHIYMEGASGAIIVCDVTRAATHKTALGLIDSFERNLPGRPAMLIMNKIDLLAGDKSHLLSPPPTIGIETVWTSARTGHQVLEAFARIGRQCISRGLER